MNALNKEMLLGVLHEHVHAYQVADPALSLEQALAKAARTAVAVHDVMTLEIALRVAATELGVSSELADLFAPPPGGASAALSDPGTAQIPLRSGQLYPTGPSLDRGSSA